MRLKIFIIATLFTISSLYGSLSSSQIQQAKKMVSANPSLLNTPMAKEAIKNQTQGVFEPSEVVSESSIKQNIEQNESLNTKNESDDKHKILNRVDDITKNLRLNPQKYLSNSEELMRIRSTHTKRSTKTLQRFSKEFFRNKNKIATKNVNIPSDYIINRGDTITFWVYGATNRKHQLKVNNRGNINIPEIGPVRVAGEKYAEVKELLTNYLSSSYKNSDVVVDLNSYSTAQITLTGFVNAPGIFNTTSVSSVKDILIESGGVSDVGSVRAIEVKRAGVTIATIDYYNLLTLGLDNGDVVLQPNDTIHVPRAYGLVRLEGAVNKEAIFEIKEGEVLSNILRVAGGIKSEADRLRIYIKRYSNHTQIRYHKITLKEANYFSLRDGDEIYVGEMRDINERYIEVVGNVLNEGKREIRSSSIKLSTLLKKEIRGGKLDSFFLENTQLDYAVIKRVGKDLTPQMFNVNLKNILDGVEDFTLKNRDILYIYNKLDTSINQFVTITQALTESEINEDNRTQNLLIEDGKHLYTEGMTLKDLIHSAGIKGSFDTSRVKIVGHNRTDIKIIDYQKEPEYKLKPFDTVYLFDFFDTNPVKMAHIVGEVVKPGSYEVAEAMTLKSFIESAGGLNDRAYPKRCEIIRYYIENGERQKKIFNVDIKDIDSFLVQPYDEINIKRIPNWYERRTVTITGEVKFPGTYVIHSGEKLSSLIKRAGGYTKDAFLYGAVFTREEIAKLQKESLRVELSKLKEQVIFASLRASGSKTMSAINIDEGIKAVESLMKEAEELTPIGRISINLESNAIDNSYCNSCNRHHNISSSTDMVDSAIESLKGTPSDLTLKDKDKLHIPSFNDTVVVSGEVMNPVATIYLGDDIRDYISKSGGLTELADTDHIYVMHANGEAQKATLGSYLFSSNKVTVKRGDVIIVPKKLMFQRGIDVAGEIADIFYKLTLTVAAMKTVGAL